MEDVSTLLHMLSSKRVMERKLAIKLLKKHIGSSYLAALSLQYVSEHDPCYTVRNIARQTVQPFKSTNDDVVWEKVFSF
jgi:hypothetical protein